MKKLCYISTLPPLLAASVAWAQVPLTDSDMEWRKSPRTAIDTQERKHTAATLPDNANNNVTPIWSLETADGTLSNTLSRWSRQEKWQLIWEADRDFPILATVYLKGSFQSVILSVMQSLSDSDYPLQAILNPNTRIVRIVRYMQAPNGCHCAHLWSALCATAHLGWLGISERF